MTKLRVPEINETALGSLEKPVERLARPSATMVAYSLLNYVSGHFCGLKNLTARRLFTIPQNIQIVPHLFSRYYHRFHRLMLENKGIDPQGCNMEYIKEIKGVDCVADLYQGPESRYESELGFVFVCVTPRAREEFPMCLKSSPGIGLIFVPVVYYKAFVRLCDEKELVILPEY